VTRSFFSYLASSFQFIFDFLICQLSGQSELGGAAAVEQLAGREYF